MGKMGAGALIVCGNHVLLQQRAPEEHEPLSWCIFGGMADKGEATYDAMVREVREESGIDLTGHPVRFIDTFHDERDDFRFHTFVVDVPEMVTPTLSAESVGASWFELGPTRERLWENLPEPLQTGFKLFTEKQFVARSMIPTPDKPGDDLVEVPAHLDVEQAAQFIRDEMIKRGYDPDRAYLAEVGHLPMTDESPLTVKMTFQYD